MKDMIDAVIDAGLVTFATEVAVQPFASVTVTVYVPEQSPEAVCVVCELISVHW